MAVSRVLCTWEKGKKSFSQEHQIHKHDHQIHLFWHHPHRCFHFLVAGSLSIITIGITRGRTCENETFTPSLGLPNTKISWKKPTTLQRNDIKQKNSLLIYLAPQMICSQSCWNSYLSAHSLIWHHSPGPASQKSILVSNSSTHSDPPRILSNMGRGLSGNSDRS